MNEFCGVIVLVLVLTRGYEKCVVFVNIHYNKTNGRKHRYLCALLDIEELKFASNFRRRISPHSYRCNDIKTLYSTRSVKRLTSISILKLGKYTYNRRPYRPAAISHRQPLTLPILKL